MKKLKKELSTLKSIVKNPTVRILPGQIAYFLVLSIFPLVILVGLIASIFSLSVDTIIEAISTAFPEKVVNLILPFLTGKGFDTNVGIFTIIGFLIASNGAYSIIQASNAIYGFPDAEWLKQRIKALLIIVLIIGTFIFTLVVLAFGDIIMEAILSSLSSESLKNIIYQSVMYARWPTAMLVIYFNIKLIYTIAPDWKILSKYTTKGAVFTTVGWVITTAIYSYYANHFSNYDFFYGGLSNIIILMIWVYALSYILVVGIAINVNKYQNEGERE